MKNKKVVLPIVILAAVAVTITILAALSIGGYILYRSQRTPTQQLSVELKPEQPSDEELVRRDLKKPGPISSSTFSLMKASKR